MNGEMIALIRIVIAFDAIMLLYVFYPHYHAHYNGSVTNDEWNAVEPFILSVSKSV